jgi:hypothetical protein
MRPVMGRTVVVALLCAGCSADANYTLRLVPRVPTNQSPFDGAPEAHLRLRDASGNVDWIPLGSFGSGTREERGLGALDRHTVGLLLGPADPTSSLAGLVAWGESSPVTLGGGRTERSVDVLVARVDGVGTLADLGSARIGAAAAALSDGRVYLFGGAPDGGGACGASIQRLPTLQAGSWSFSAVRGALPTGVCNAVATVVEIDGREQIVVSGGETTLNAHDQRVRTVAIFDPQSDEVVWSGDANLTRARHAARAFPGGVVLLVGASQSGSSAPTEATWEVFNAATRAFDSFGGSSLPPWDLMSAPLPGALAVCGGGYWSGATVTPATTCLSFGPDGTTTPLPALPTALRAGAMTSLADGSLLVVGGIEVTGDAGQALPATDRAYLLSAGAASWVALPSIALPRAYARLAPDAAGGAVLLGGVAAGWGYRGAIAASPSCGERLVRDGATTGRWEPLQPCANAASGLLPTVAASPGGLLFMLEGRSDGNLGGKSFGVAGLGP